jgi:protein-tyrosine phosphatase
MAEFIMKDMVRREGMEQDVYIASSATSTEEIWNGIGNPVYPPARDELKKHGLSCDGKRAVQLDSSDYDKYDLFIGMDGANIRNMTRILNGDAQGKIRKMMSYTSRGGDVADPWYSGNFDVTYRDIYDGCKGLMEELKKYE